MIDTNTATLLGPQLPHAKRLLDSLYLNGIAADMSPTGVGKTYVAAWIAKQLNAPALIVVCPNAPDWEKVLAKFDVKPWLIITYEKLMRGHTKYLHYREQSIDPISGKEKNEPRCHRAQVNFPAGALVVLDEAHKCKGVSSLNSGLLISLKRQGFKVLTLSATQATNPGEMRAFGFATNLHNLTKWKAWCLDKGAKEVGFRGDISFDPDDVAAQKKMAEVHENLFDTQQIASRLTRKEMGNLFPENHITAEAFDLGENSPKIQAVYDEMERELDALEESSEKYSEHIFAIITKARRRAEMLKIPLLQEMTEDLHSEGKSVAIFLNYTESIAALQSRLTPKFGGKIGLIYGEQSKKDRWEDVNDFQADKKRILICNLKSGGVALSYHDLNGKYPRATLISPSFSAVDMLQALGRIHRQGGLTHCYQRIVFAANCIEVRCCRKVQARLNNLSFLVDGDLCEGFKLFR
jgi:superfamily II DNA or RNA helicase